MYNGFRTPWRLFRVQHALTGARHRRSRRLAAGEAWRHALLPARYPSQWRAWAGLWPEHLLKRGLLRREVLLSVDTRRASERPHDGPLLYERRTGWTYEAFRSAAAAFAARHLVRAPGSLS
jgi:hypothetical protein